MNPSRTILATTLSSSLTRVATRSFAKPATSAGLRLGGSIFHPINPNSHKHFSTSTPSRIEFFPPAPETENIKRTPAAWEHPIATEEQLNSIQIAHRETRTFADRAAYNLVRICRWATDFATGYRNEPNKPYVMNERKWFTRFIFLETVAAVPGMTAGMLRHFRSLRRMQRDNGWIETMLEDAYNERMHLLTFMKMAEPGRLMKFLVIGAQGVFANGFFLGYLISPSFAHRFVGYLEEEAVKTYTQAIKDLDDGKIPAWKNLQAPDLAVQYWNMPEGKRTMRDLLLYVRADEAKHREIHHTLGNLNQKVDPNPFVSVYKNAGRPHPSNTFEHLKPKGWEREEVL